MSTIEPAVSVELPGQQHVLDYELADAVSAETPDQLKALGDETRTAILTLLLERSATASQLADALGRPRGTVGYHVKVLEDAGLVKVVRRRKVRALTEKYYGRTGRTIVVRGLPGRAGPFFMLDEARREAVVDADGALPMFTIRRARMTEAQAVEFAARVVALADEFAAAPRAGSTVYGIVAGVYPTALPSLPDSQEGDE